ncbi:MAG: hypothetical protein RMY29_030575 [Nostoc sp. CreGUA01]|nr:hypothetical protein [Nostoc sp. CreGUA01]
MVSRHWVLGIGYFSLTPSSPSSPSSFHLLTSSVEIIQKPEIFLY